MPTTKIKKGLRTYSKQVHPRHASLFESLGDAQRPETMLITCSDSRVDPALITQTLPGELFVLRNAGNLVGQYGSGDSAQAGTIEFAVKALRVCHIVVCGHSRCGAMAAILDPDSLADLPATGGWLKAAGPGRAPGPEPTLDDQVRFNVLAQIENLRTHPAVHEAVRGGVLQLHGWVYDFLAGKVVELDIKPIDASEDERTV